MLLPSGFIEESMIIKYEQIVYSGELRDQYIKNGLTKT